MKGRILGSFIGLIICILLMAMMFSPEEKKEEVVKEEVKAQVEVQEPEEVKEEVKFYREDIPLTYEEQAYLYEVCELNLVPYDLALAVIYVETGFRNVIGDNGNSYGYFQIQPRWTEKEMGYYGITDLMDYKQNFMLGTGLLGANIYNHGLVGGLTKYNTGQPGDSEYAAKVIKVRKEVINNELVSD